MKLSEIYVEYEKACLSLEKHVNESYPEYKQELELSWYCDKPETGMIEVEMTRHNPVTGSIDHHKFIVRDYEV